MRALVFDLGGTYLRCARSEDGVLADVTQASIVNFTHRVAVDEIWDRILAAVTTFSAEQADRVGSDAPIVFSVPGPVDDGWLVGAPTVAGISVSPIDIAGALRARTGRAVHLLNDLSAAAWWAHDACDAERFIVVTVSSGIGSKVVLRGASPPVIDTPRFAGEIGHVRVNHAEDAWLCDCGRPGHLGSIASGRGILRTVQHRAARDAASFAASACGVAAGGDPARLTNEQHIVPALRQRDPWTTSVVSDATLLLGQVLMSVVTAVGLDRIVVIGGFAQALGAIYRDLLEDAVRRAGNYDVLDADRRWVEVAAESQPCLAGTARFIERLARA